MTKLLSNDDPYWKSDEFRKLSTATRLTIWRERCFDFQLNKDKEQLQSPAPINETEDELYQRQMDEMHWRWAKMLSEQGEAQRQAAAAAEIVNPATKEPEVETVREMLRRIKDPVRRLQRARELGVQ